MTCYHLFTSSPCTANYSLALLDPNCEECGFDSNNMLICIACKVGFRSTGGKCGREGMCSLNMTLRSPLLLPYHSFFLSLSAIWTPLHLHQCFSINYADIIVTISVVSVAIIMVLAVAIIVTFALVFVRVKRKRAALLQHDYDYPIPQLPKGIQNQQQNEIMHTMDGRQESSIDIFNTSLFARTTSKEGEPADSDSFYATIGDTKADVRIRMNENSAYQSSTNFSLARNPAYGTNVDIAPGIETKENAAYHCDIAIL